MRSSVVATSGHESPLLLCLSHLRWNFVWQRPQHLMSRAAKHYRVLFLEEPMFEHGGSPRLSVEQVQPGVRVAVPVLPANMGADDLQIVQRRLIDDFLEEDGSLPAVLWYYAPRALGFSDHLDADAIVYDNMDELSAFRGAPPDLVAWEDALLARADLVFTGGFSLFEAKRHRHGRITAFPSSIDVAHFARARTRDLTDPADQVAIPRPRLGFFGVIDERLDTALVADIADLRPDWQLVMIGPTAKIDPADLPRRPNIHWLGMKTYAELPEYLAHWDIGLMPFAINEATRFISPTKTPEFLAAGCPVISTPIADVVRPYGERGLVEIASTAWAFVNCAAKLLTRPKEGWMADVDRHLRTQSWDRTWSAMHEQIERRRRPANPKISALASAVS